MFAVTTTLTLVLALFASACGSDDVGHVPDAPLPFDTAPDTPGQVGPAVGGEAAGDQAGWTVALSADGKRVIIGSLHSSATGADSGQARVFDRNDNTWVQVGADLDGEAAGDRYGGAVAISNDGSRVAVGSYLNDGNGNTSGHVRVFELVGGAWTQLGADLDGAGAGAGHGWTLALSGSGSRIVVGAPVANNTNGSAYVYDLVGGAWTPVGTPVANDHEFGHDVDISDDGNRIAVGSPSPQSSDQWPGRVEVYEWSGTAWVPLGAAIAGVEASAGAGTSIALSAAGDVLAIGSSTSNSAGANSGEVRVLRWNAGTWIPVGAAFGGPIGSTLGLSVALSADGTRLLAGGPVGVGTARLYTLAADTWTQTMGPDFGSGAHTGAAVALSADGRVAAIGAPYADSPANQSGEVRVYDLP